MSSRGRERADGSTVACISLVREELPRSAFARRPQRLLEAIPHALVTLGALAGIGICGPAYRPLLAVVAGHGMACLGFIAHELSHGSVLPRGGWRTAFELLLFGLNWTPPTVWRRVHNELHHAHAGTAQDPDRAFMESERCAVTHWYSRIFYPSSSALVRWNPLVMFHYIPYTIRNVAAAFLPRNELLGLIPAKPQYTKRQQRRILGELLAILVLQGCVFWLSGGKLATYLWAGPVALLICSGVVMTYVFTNHFTEPIQDAANPVQGTTSVIVPKWVDILHGNFSYHTEHHLFPSMSSRSLPLVSRVLASEHVEHYKRIGLRDAWDSLWKRRDFEQVGNDPVQPSKAGPARV